MAEVTSPRMEERIWALVDTIAGMPGMGSVLVADSLVRLYGTRVLKAIVSPFIIIYEYDRESDTVTMLDLLNARHVT